MKILLDECVSRKAKRLFANYEVSTVPEEGFAGLKNGKLLTASEDAGFDILLTIDKNMNYQQNINKFELVLVVFGVFKSGVKYMEELMPEFERQVDSFEKGKCYVIEKNDEDDPILSA